MSTDGPVPATPRPRPAGCSRSSARSPSSRPWPTPAASIGLSQLAERRRPAAAHHPPPGAHARRPRLRAPGAVAPVLPRPAADPARRDDLAHARHAGRGPTWRSSPTSSGSRSTSRCSTATRSSTSAQVHGLAQLDADVHRGRPPRPPALPPAVGKAISPTSTPTRGARPARAHRDAALTPSTRSPTPEEFVGRARAHPRGAATPSTRASRRSASAASPSRCPTPRSLALSMSGPVPA